MRDGAYKRRSARVLLLDGDGRILLFRCYLDSSRPGLGHCWVTPGGGVNDGETLVEAAVRELREETGLVVRCDDVGPRRRAALSRPLPSPLRRRTVQGGRQLLGQRGQFGGGQAAYPPGGQLEPCPVRPLQHHPGVRRAVP